MTINLDNLVRDLRFWQEEWQLPDDHVVTEAAVVIERLRRALETIAALTDERGEIGSTARAALSVPQGQQT